MAKPAQKADPKKGAAKKITLHDTKNWYADRYQLVVIQRNVLALITFLALAGLGGSVMAVATLNASKTFEPYVIEVEEKTGVTTQVPYDTVVRYRADEAIIRYFMVKYVMAREAYNVNNYQYFYTQVVRVLSTGEIYQGFRREIDINNEASPVNLGRAAAKIVEVKSVVFTGKDQAQIRFAVYTRDGADGSGRTNKEFHAVATINYDFLDLDLTMQERYINPLGFQVISYRVDEDRAI